MTDVEAEALIVKTMASSQDVSMKVIRLWALTMMFYREPVGDHAFDEIRVLIGQDALDALCFLMGYCAGGNGNADWSLLAKDRPRRKNDLKPG